MNQKKHTESASVIVTEYNGGEIEKTQQMLSFEVDEGQEKDSINLYPQIEFQTIEGFGATLTEAAAYTFSQMSEGVKQEFLEKCFGEDGLRYSQTRMSMDSCDASLDNYSAMERSDDPDLSSFSLERDETYILPFYRAVTAFRGEPLCVMLSPWSPPPFMKTNGEKNHGGRLKKEYRALWAEYFCRYIKEYRDRGADVRRISIQNEPNAVQTWDSCCYDGAEEKDFLQNYLYPALKCHGLDDLEIFIWDHNKERALERAQEVLDSDTDEMVDGIAFHWYSGDHFEVLDLLGRLYPDKKLAFTEGCVEYSQFSAEDHLANARMYGHDLIGNINGGSSFLVNWSILFNSQGGPNHVENWCEAPAMYDEKEDRIEWKLSYDYLWHLSHFIVPGSMRIGFSRFTDQIDMTAVKRPDGSLAVVLMNRTDEEKNIWLRLEGQKAAVKLPGNSIATAVIS